MAKTKTNKKYLDDGQKENTVGRSRKRKPSGQLQPPKNKSSKTTWNISDSDTSRLYKEMGVESLSDSSNSSHLDELTPEIFNTSLIHTVPGLPSGQQKCMVTIKTVPFDYVLVLLCLHHMNLLKPEVKSGASEGDRAPRVLLPCQKVNSTDTENKSPLSLSPPTCSLYEDHDSSLLLVKSICDTDTQLDLFESLSDEIILTIFGWLPKFTLAKCARVCHRWSCLVMDDSLWKRLDLSNKTISPGTLGNVLNRGVQILRLTKAEIEGPTFLGPTSLIKSFRLSRVQYLDLSMASVSTEVLSEVFSVCRDLKKVSLEHCQLDDSVCQNLGENKNLEAINFSMCQGITSAGMMPITTNCRKLESLNLAWCGLQRNCIVYLSLCLPPSLRKLNISGLRENITDEEILQFSKTCPRLKELDLSDCTVLTSTSVVHIAKYLTELEYLALSRCYRIPPNSVPGLTQIDSLLAVDVFGMLREGALQQLREAMFRIEINKFPFSSIARPTTGIRRTSIWGLRVRDNVV